MTTNGCSRRLRMIDVQTLRAQENAALTNKSKDTFRYSTVRKYFVLTVFGIVAFSICILGGCNLNNTEEEHIAIIRKKLNDYYRNERIYVRGDDGVTTSEYVTVESFEVELLKAADGELEYFLVTFKPFYLGYQVGIIMGNQYRILWGTINNSNNPFEERGIEKGNRFFIYKDDTSWDGLAFRKNGDFVDLRTGRIYSKKEIEQSLNYWRSPKGRSIIRRYSFKI